MGTRKETPYVRDSGKLGRQKRIDKMSMTVAETREGKNRNNWREKIDSVPLGIMATATSMASSPSPSPAD